MYAQRGSITVVPVKVGNFPLVSASATRVTIAFAFTSATPNTAINHRPIANIDDGWLLGQSSWPNFLTYEMYGTLVCDPWYGFGAAAAGSVIVFEGFGE